jgi:copper(I)-binding protein
MRRFDTLFAVAAMIALGAGMAPAAGADEKEIHLENAWARKAPAMAQGAPGGHGAPAAGMGNGAVYVTIENHGGTPDALLGASTDVAGTVELHETINEGGVMRMRPLPKFDVAGGAKLEMKPGGHHIMLLGLKRDLKTGDRVKVTLTFEKAGRMALEAPVR